MEIGNGREKNGIWDLGVRSSPWNAIQGKKWFRVGVLTYFDYVAGRIRINVIIR